MTLQTAICEMQSLPDVAGAPSDIHILPLGFFKGRDGRSWTVDDPQRLIDAFKVRGVDLPIDYEHQSDKAPESKSGPVPAAGWIKGLEIRADGIWGKVTWTKQAARLIEDKEYRFISPVFVHDTRGRVMRIKSAGLVHTPNLQLTALAGEYIEMDAKTIKVTDLAKALGLSEDTELSEILEQIKQNTTPDPAKYVPIEAVSDLISQRNSQSDEMHEKDVERRVQDALNSGHITPAMCDWATALCRQDPDSFDGFLSSSTPAYAHLFKRNDHLTRDSIKSNMVPDEAHVAICKQLDIDPSKMMSS